MVRPHRPGRRGRGPARPSSTEPRPSSVEFTIGQIVAGGAGMADLDGRKVFVPFTAPGERVSAHLVVSKRDYAVAKLDAIIEPSSQRRESPCPLFGRCGGCQLQHLVYEEQLRAKREMVADAVRRIGRIEVEVAPVRPAPDEWRYRNKTQYAVGFDHGPVIGFFRAGTHRIIPAETCLLHPPTFDAARRAMAGWLEGAAGEAYREDTHTGNVRHLILRTDGTRTIAVVATRTRDIAPELIGRLQATPGITAVIQTVNAEPTNRILGQRMQPIIGEPDLEYQLAGVRLAVSPAAFFQVNTTQAGAVAELVRERLAGRHLGHVVDLYCGVGAIALALADRADRVTGIEIDPAAVADARRNAVLNTRENIDFRQGDAAELIAEAVPADAVVLDPPRKGCDRLLLDTLAKARPARVVYVSCDPATLARDLALLVGTGYRVVSIEPVDMFPQTAHVETVATLESGDA